MKTGAKMIKMKNAIIFLLLLALGCSQQPATVIPQWIPYDESEELAINANHESFRMRFKLIQSQILDKNEIWEDDSQIHQLYVYRGQIINKKGKVVIKIGSEGMIIPNGMEEIAFSRT